jgi:phosphatidylglycerol---prolipoprotein diacylglyceryl transferase
LVGFAPAVIDLAFDPFLRFGELQVPWRAVGVALAVFVALAVGLVLARRLGLRSDDLLFIVVGIVPGAVIGGRLVHGLVFLEAYRADPLALADPARGSLSLLGAVLGGSLTGAYIASRLEGPVGGWTDAAAAPMLIAIGLGKIAQALAGSGQGLPADLVWAVAFTGPGPWGSPSADVPAHPSQIYEGIWALAGAPLALILGKRAAERGTLGLGRVFLAALAWWLTGRIIVATTWRDPRLLAGLDAEQILALGVLALIVGSILSAVVRLGGEEPVRDEASAPAEGVAADAADHPPP